MGCNHGGFRMEQKEQFHGSDLEKIEQLYHIKKEAIIGFSSNVNPLGLSPKMKESIITQIDSISTYPDRNYLSLRTSIAAYVSCDINHMILGNGSSELISNIIKIQNPQNALILAPTYSEYERELSLNACTCTYFSLDAAKDFAFDFIAFENELINHTYDFFVLCNPNNPTSTALTQKDIKKLLQIAYRHHVFVMIDETYVEFTSDVSCYSAIPLVSDFSNLAVLRGTSKFFASPGLRLGYAITSNHTLLETSNQEKNPWMIHSLAVVAGESMFFDTDYIKRTHTYIQQEQQRIQKKLSAISNIKYFTPYANFILVKLLHKKASAQKLFEYLIRKNIMIRNCSDFHSLDDSYIRFCFLHESENDLLISELKNYMDSL